MLQVRALDAKNLEEVAGILHGNIDFAESRSEGRLVPKAGIHEELDRLRDMYSSLDELLVSRLLVCTCP